MKMTQVKRILLCLALSFAVIVPVFAAPDEWESDFGDEIVFLSGQDDEQFSVTLNFGFPFNGTNYTTVWIGINGSVQLGTLGNDGDIDYDHWNNMEEFVSDGAPSIAGFNSDLDLSSIGTIHFNDFGDRAVFTWNEVGTNENENALLSFQIQLFENGKIVISYNGVLDGSGEDLLSDLDEGVVVGISAGLQAAGTEQGPSDLNNAFTSPSTELYERWCFDEASSCGFNGNNDGLSGLINTAFDLEQRSIVYNPGPNGGFSVNEPVPYVVGGSLTGLAVGNSVVLQNNLGDDLTLNANGAFNFSSLISDGGAYSVTVATQPTSPNQTCVVTNGSGTVAGSNVEDVAISCTTDTTPTYTIGGNVSGLASGNSVVLSNNSDVVTVNANGSFTFPTSLADGSNYTVVVSTQPISPSQKCIVTNGSGAVAGNNIDNVAVSCTTDIIPTYTIGGDVSGLAESNSVVLRNNSDEVAINANGSFTFPTALDDGSNYVVVVSTQPTSPDKTCSVSNGRGTISGANITNVIVNCINDGPIIPGVAKPIPTLGEWARILLSLILALTVWVQTRYRHE